MRSWHNVFVDEGLSKKKGKTRHALKPFNHIKISGTTWFSRSKGWSYGAVRVYVDGKFVGYREDSCAGGDYYRSLGFTVLQDLGFYPKTDERLVSGFRADKYKFDQDVLDFPEKFTLSCSEVSRKKDL